MFKFLSKKEEKAEEVAETELTDLVNVSKRKFEQGTSCRDCK
ncbi:hypothetical protein RV11_GL003484 [Enterococcus phoeniculicola]|uniref:Uncharacterized protein n=1 Tax=Enterococcus phoeniculicola ATCC BAA-412 TaxID=1158610 RepID=R3W2Y7_9ENTE|nr:hypothetical protein [Enterococcus phoeniculicola]EOL42022.1 hypothetical protein UC3_02370 [Enterococcus phoeniculicola ATCC BAA-412]EOT79699.1 hypothetical protein I589_01211 [Enterococcus phoeniculicola ATCC BAA-412]OJG71763.1 hypothetical protein RV11_GL003484 [Enterococcus phoeniculicola]